MLCSNGRTKAVPLIGHRSEDGIMAAAQTGPRRGLLPVIHKRIPHAELPKPWSSCD